MLCHSTHNISVDSLISTPVTVFVGLDFLSDRIKWVLGLFLVDTFVLQIQYSSLLAGFFIIFLINTLVLQMLCFNCSTPAKEGRNFCSASCASKFRWAHYEPKRQKHLARERVKKRARQALRRARLAGELLKPLFCQLCSKEDKWLNAHHEDYSKPLDVIWLCSKCHIARHKEMKKLSITAKGLPD